MGEGEIFMKSMRQPSICFVSPFAYPILVGEGGGPGGAERQFFFFGREMKKQNWRVSYIVDRSSIKNKNLDTLLPVLTSSFKFMGGKNVYIIFDWLNLMLAMKRAQADYYVIKTPGHLSAPMAFFCKISKKKLVFWSQMSSDFNRSEKSNRTLANILHDWGVKNSDIVIGQTKQQCQDFMNNYRKIIFHVPSMCGQILTMRKEIEGKENIADVDILWVGNSLCKKRYEVVIELARKMPDVTFVLAMNKAHLVRFEQAETESKSLENVRFLGQIPPYEMENWFDRSKIFLNTSSAEGFPNTFLQAWMNYLPVISLEIDPDGVIAKRNLGRVVGADRTGNCRGNASCLAELLVPHVKMLLLDNGLRKCMGKEGKIYVTNNHFPDIATSSLLHALTNQSTSI